MSCHCSKNRNRLALLVDRASVDDLPEDVRRILANCPTCREHYELLRAAIGSLRETQSGNSVQLEKSLWPKLSDRLPEPFPQVSRYQEWKQKFVPIFSVTAACLALLVVFMGQQPSRNKDRVYQTTVNRGSAYSPFLQYSASFNEGESASQQSHPGSSYIDPFSQDLYFYPEIDSDFPDAEMLDAHLKELLRQQKRLHPEIE